MKCPNCGAEIEAESAFCMSCGARTPPPAASDASPGVDPRASTEAPAVASQDATTEQVEVHPQREDALLVATRGALADEYEIQRELGRGGMAVVYEGVETELGRRVAVKVLPPEMATKDTAERFRREARMAASLDHPNIIPVYRVGQAEGIQYMAMKFVDGRGLDEIVKEQGALPIPVVVRIIADSARALAFAHENGVIHRDIKGANILIEKDGRVLVTDFGIARAVGDHTITATGMVMGTPSYMSPEQCGGIKLTHQSDQYSLGVLAFQLLTGSLPFSAETFVGLVQHHYMTPPPDIRRVREDAPDALLAIVYRALAKKPEERFPNTKQMVAALDAVPLTADERTEADHTLQELVTGGRVSRVEIDELPPLVTPMETALASVAPATNRWPAIVASAALVVAAASIGVAWQAGLFTEEQGTDPPTSAQPTDYLLTITGVPEGARCSLDGLPFPDCAGNVSPGRHTYSIFGNPAFDRLDRISFRMPNEAHTFSVGEMLRERTTQAQSNRARRQTTPVDSGSVLVRITNTQVATILLDGNAIQNGTPVQIPVGRHEISVTADGFAPIDTFVVVERSRQARLPLTLVRSNQQ